MQGIPGIRAFVLAEYIYWLLLLIIVLTRRFLLFHIISLLEMKNKWHMER